MTTLLRARGPFRTLWWSRAVSFTGDGIGRTALVLTAAEHGPTAVSLVLLAVALPRFLGPIAGALADRMEQRRLMAVCEVGQAVTFALLAVFLPALPVLLALVLVTSCFATAFVPAGRSAVPALVAGADLGRANALLGTAFNIQLALGPTIGGFMTEWGGARWAFAVNALAFAVSALILLRLPALPSHSTDGLWSSTVAGLRYVATTPGPRALVTFLFLAVSFAAIDNVALVFLVEGDLGGSAADFGLVQAAYGVGMLAASGVLGLVMGRNAVWLLVSGVLLVATGTAATAVAPALLVAAALQAVAGMGNAAENIAGDTLVQRLVPRPMLGRAFGATSTAAQLGSATAYLVAAPLLSAAGPRVTFVIAGAGTALALLVALPALRRVSRDRRPRRPTPGRHL
ncbi:MFS transporter [Actinophytocola sp.]|uniref:MFS transporter n=1 Tax=Actinophytocola sp. TaxID=1872138 RepID=UPI0025C6CA11|nr:MFS transporter [Actinophytocola sp.]